MESGAHALVLMDQAGWHTTNKLAIPTNITIIALPARLQEGLGVGSYAGTAAASRSCSFFISRQAWSSGSV